jgi:hypothetical protein
MYRKEIEPKGAVASGNDREGDEPWCFTKALSTVITSVFKELNWRL